MERARGISRTANCKKCGSDIFKVRITIDEQGNVHWQPECVACKGVPSSVYVNNEGTKIDEDDRAQLMLKNKIKKLEEDLNHKEKSIEKLEEELLSKQNIITSLEAIILNLNIIIDEKASNLDDFESELNRCKEYISELENNIQDLQWDTDSFR